MPDRGGDKNLKKTKINVSKSEVPRLVKDGFVIEANQRRKDFEKDA